jgi:CheY-like chemotaxis protein/two-component sensor histidine kinase
MIERQVQQMVRLVDDLLDLSRISRGKTELRQERVELAAVLYSAVETSRPLIEQSGHELTVTLPPEPIPLDGDPTRLAQVFSNLLNNAAKYTAGAGHIWLTAEREDGSGSVTVRVRDNGLGISEEMLPLIFEMFTQVDRSLERAQGGLGIGLTLVKRLVEMHGGTVEARSKGPNRGSEFAVRLPVASEMKPTEKRAMASGGENIISRPKRRILVVDDNRDSVESLAMMLRMMGNEVRTAFDGIEAVDAAGTFNPEVILLDIGLPRLNGFDAARRIRGQEGGKNMVIVALTGWGQKEDRRRSQEAGFDHHIVKPVDPATLEKLLVGLEDSHD